jgi:hypothetical protein
MFKQVRDAIRDGRVFTNEADLTRYLNRLRGGLVRHGKLPTNWKLQQGRILAKFRAGTLRPSDPVKVVSK